MSDLFGFSRDVVKERYALRTPSGFVPSVLPGWTNAVCVVQISPAMGADFSQWLVSFEAEGEGRGNTGNIEYFIYLVAGNCTAKVDGKKQTLTGGSYVYLPPQTNFQFKAAEEETQLLIFLKKFEPLAGVNRPEVIVSHERKVTGKPFLGNTGARLQVLLPDKPEFDLAVNIFTYQPGATLPFVESHVMEHGLQMLRGQGIYRLDTDWHPVRAGDVIWMAPYCPQWFVAMGTTSASYIYYKNVNRAPM